MAAKALQSHPEFSQGSRRNASSFPPALSPAALLDVPSIFPRWPILNPPEISSCTEGWEPFFFVLPNGKCEERGLGGYWIRAESVGPSALIDFMLTTEEPKYEGGEAFRLQARIPVFCL